MDFDRIIGASWEFVKWARVISLLRGNLGQTGTLSVCLVDTSIGGHHLDNEVEST